MGDFESKIYKFFEENRGKGFTFQEIYQVVYPNLINIDFNKKWKEILVNFGGTFALNTILDNLKKKKNLMTIFSGEIQYFYLD